MSWADLRELRKQGMAPSFPVVITTGSYPRALGELGCLVIQHKAGDPFPAELLEDIRVWCFLGGCDRGQAVVKAMASKGVKPAEFKSWCECSQRLDSMPVRCEVGREWQH